MDKATETMTRLCGKHGYIEQEQVKKHRTSALAKLAQLRNHNWREEHQELVNVVRAAIIANKLQTLDDFIKFPELLKLDELVKLDKIPFDEDWQAVLLIEAIIQDIYLAATFAEGYGTSKKGLNRRQLLAGVYWVENLDAPAIEK